MSESVGGRGLVMQADNSWKEAFWPRRSRLERDQAVTNMFQDKSKGGNVNSWRR